jgi:ubiquitin carboxyl-terminal hydrolase 5/13
MNEDNEGASSSSSASSAPIPDNAIVQAIVGMGFSENAGRRAALATSNVGTPQATEWLFGHMEDPDLNDPILSEGSSSSSHADPALVAQICSMGFSSEQAEFALSQPGNGSPDAAVMWLFGHQAELPALMAAAADAGSKSSAAQGSFDGAKEEDEQNNNARSGQYRLIGFISHVGKSTGSGHYVCHIQKKVDGEMKWVIHNDRKIAISQNPPRGHGYLYLYAHK